MIRLAWRNLFQNKTRLLISIGGVALALLLILVLDAVVTGVQAQVTSFIDNSNADVIVSQENVRNMHMAYSALPVSYETRVRNVAGVASVTPVHYLTNLIEVGETRNLVYVIGLPRVVEAGGPWRVVAGKQLPSEGEAIIDRGVATNSGIGLGAIVKILGTELKVTGLSEGTATISGGSVAFISEKDFVEQRKDAGSVSFLFVRARPGTPPSELASRIARQAGNVTAQTRGEFADRERQVINDMSTDIISIMNLIGFLIGLAVTALTVYTATFSRRAEYGVLKALGADTQHLYAVVLAQAFISVVLGFILGLAITVLLVASVPVFNVPVALGLSWSALVKVAVVSLVIASASAVLPIRQIAGVDPVLVFKGR